MWIWMMVLLAGCEPDKTVAGAPSSSLPEETTPPEPASPCTIERFDEEGGTLQVAGVSVEIPVDYFDGPKEVSLCPAEAPEGFSLRSEAWELSVDEGRWPLSITVAHDGEAPALFVPGQEGLPVRSLTATIDEETAEGIVYRGGLLFVADDPRAIATYEPSSALDLLFVVDNSATMADEQAKLADSFPLIYDLILARISDYHVGIISTDLDDPAHQGRLREAGGARWIEPATVDPTGSFRDMVEMGMTGSPIEQGIGAAYLALDALYEDYNAGFLRDETHLALVVMSDEDDWTAPELITPTEMGSYLLDLEADRPEVSFHVLGAGARYSSVTSAVGGLTESISASWDSFFEAALDEVEAVPFILDPGAAALPEAWVLPASGGEPYQLPAEAVTFDAGSQEATVDLSLVSPGDVVWLIYSPLSPA